MKIKELLKDKKQIIVVLNKTNKRDFLSNASIEGFKWINGSNINKDDDCFFHIFVSQVNTIANIPAMQLCKTKAFNNVEKIKY